MIGYILAALGAGAYVYKKKPSWLPKGLQPKAHAQKINALANVSATSVPTPSSIAGMDPGMTSAEVAAANGLLSSATDSAPLYAMASDYSAKDYVQTSQALIAKAEALDVAKRHGADEASLTAQMEAAATSAEAGGAVGEVNLPGMKFPT